MQHIFIYNCIRKKNSYSLIFLNGQFFTLHEVHENDNVVQVSSMQTKYKIYLR